jgi:hypothetical protein
MISVATGRHGSHGCLEVLNLSSRADWQPTAARKRMSANLEAIDKRPQDDDSPETSWTSQNFAKLGSF